MYCANILYRVYVYNVNIVHVFACMHLIEICNIYTYKASEKGKQNAYWLGE